MRVGSQSRRVEPGTRVCGPHDVHHVRGGRGTDEPLRVGDGRRRIRFLDRRWNASSGLSHGLLYIDRVGWRDAIASFFCAFCAVEQRGLLGAEAPLTTARGPRAAGSGASDSRSGLGNTEEQGDLRRAGCYSLAPSRIGASHPPNNDREPDLHFLGAEVASPFEVTAHLRRRRRSILTPPNNRDCSPDTARATPGDTCRSTIDEGVHRVMACGANSPAPVVSFGLRVVVSTPRRADARRAASQPDR